MTSITCENARCKLRLTLKRTLSTPRLIRLLVADTLNTCSEMNVHLYDSPVHFMNVIWCIYRQFQPTCTFADRYCPTLTFVLSTGLQARLKKERGPVAKSQTVPVVFFSALTLLVGSQEHHPAWAISRERFPFGTPGGKNHGATGRRRFTRKIAVNHHHHYRRRHHHLLIQVTKPI